MARRDDVTDNGSWSYAHELYERGDPHFVVELRRLTDGDRLGNLGTRRYCDIRPEARQLLRTYLDQPLNAFRHEALVKRLFKLAESAGDDEVMGWFLVGFDRALRRRLKKQRMSASVVVATREEADALVQRWRAEGYQAGSWSNWARDETGRSLEQG